MDEDTRITLAMGLVEKAMRINGTSPRTTKDSGNLPTIFADFSGHVAWITFTIYENGWDQINWEKPGEKLRLDMKARSYSFFQDYKMINSRLDAIRLKAEKMQEKAVAADA